MPSSDRTSVISRHKYTPPPLTSHTTTVLPCRVRAKLRKLCAIIDCERIAQRRVSLATLLSPPTSACAKESNEILCLCATQRIKDISLDTDRQQRQCDQQQSSSSNSSSTQHNYGMCRRCVCVAWLRWFFGRPHRAHHMCQLHR